MLLPKNSRLLTVLVLSLLYGSAVLGMPAPSPEGTTQARGKKVRFSPSQPLSNPKVPIDMIQLPAKPGVTTESPVQPPSPGGNKTPGLEPEHLGSSSNRPHHHRPHHHRTLRHVGRINFHHLRSHGGKKPDYNNADDNYGPKVYCLASSL